MVSIPGRRVLVATAVVVFLLTDAALCQGDQRSFGLLPAQRTRQRVSRTTPAVKTHEELIAEELQRRAEEQVRREEELQRRAEEQVRREEELERRKQAEVLVQEELERRKQAEVLVQEELERRKQAEVLVQEELERRKQAEILVQEELEMRKQAEVVVQEEQETRKEDEALMKNGFQERNVEEVQNTSPGQRQIQNSRRRIPNSQRGVQNSRRRVQSNRDKVRNVTVTAPERAPVSRRKFVSRNRGGAQAPQSVGEESFVREKRNNVGAIGSGNVFHDKQEGSGSATAVENINTEFERQQANLDANLALEKGQADLGVAHEAAGLLLIQQQAQEHQRIVLERKQAAQRQEEEGLALEQQRQKSSASPILGGDDTVGVPMTDEVTALERHKANLDRKKVLEAEQAQVGVSHQVEGLNLHERQAAEHAAIARERELHVQRQEEARLEAERRRLEIEEQRKTAQQQTRVARDAKALVADDSSNDSFNFMLSLQLIIASIILTRFIG